MEVSEPVEDGAPMAQRWSRASADLRGELAAATSAFKEQKWLKKLAHAVGPASPRDEDEDDAGKGGNEGSGSPVTSMVGSASPAHSPRSVTALSVLVPQVTDDMVESLDPRFFTESFDATGYMLDALPHARDELDTFLHAEISAVDVAKDAIGTRLADDVRANHGAFIEGMKHVQDVDLDLVRAQIHVKNGRRLLVSSKNDLIRSSLEIVKTKRNRDRVEKIIHLGTRILWVFDEEAKMTTALQQHSFTTAVDICLTLRTALTTPEMEDLAILQKLKHRVQDFLPELRHQFDMSLRKVAESFNPVQYRELLQAYITLAEHAETLGFEFSDGNLRDVLSKVPEILVRCIDDLSRGHLSDLLGHQRRKSPKRQKSVPPTEKTSAKTDATVPASQLLERLRHAYEQLTDLMHTYYLLVQWHRDPFNPRNDDVAYLHRCGIDDDDDDDDDDEALDDDDHDDNHDGDENGDDAGPQGNEEESEQFNPADHGDRQRKISGSGGDKPQEESKSLSQGFQKTQSPRRPRIRNRSRGESQTQGHSRSYNHSTDSVQDRTRAEERSPYSQILCETGMTLLRYRKIVWENMQQNVMEALERLDTTYGFKLEHMITLAQLTSAIIDIGEEFTGTPSSMLRSILRLKSEQYVTSFHEDNVELLRMLADTETWQRILTASSAVSDAEGMLRLVEKRSGFKFMRDESASQTSQAIHERRVFVSFLTCGNPLDASNSERWFSGKQRDGGLLFFTDVQPGGDAENVGDIDDNDVTGGSIHREFDIANVSDMIDGEEPDEFVLTSSALSGFVRLSGVYLKMMRHLPHIAWDVFLLLVKLFEFNVYAVFTSFTDIDRATQLFQARLADTARWDTLRSCVARVSHEFSSGEILLSTAIIPAVTATSVIPVAASASKTSKNKEGSRSIRGSADSPDTGGGEQDTAKPVTLRRLTRIPRAMELSGDSNLYAFSERAVAAGSVVTQARLLEALEPLVRGCLAPRYSCLLDDVFARCVATATELRSFQYSTLAHAVVSPERVIASIQDVRWDFTELRERHNEYVVAIVRRCGELWGGLQVFSDSTGTVPVDAREAMWAALVQHVLDALLLGFAAVHPCSPQGRALMLMDVLAVQSGLDLVHHVSGQRVTRGYEYVTAYVRAFFLSSVDDLVSWIESYGHTYSKALIANLLRHGVGTTLPRARLRELVHTVDALLRAAPVA